MLAVSLSDVVTLRHFQVRLRFGNTGRSGVQGLISYSHDAITRKALEDLQQSVRNSDSEGGCR